MNRNKTLKTIHLGLLLILFLSACKGLFNTEQPHPFGDESGPIDIAPSWSPDGAEIVYNSDGYLWIMNVDGTNKRRLTY